MEVGGVPALMSLTSWSEKVTGSFMIIAGGVLCIFTCLFRRRHKLEKNKNKIK